MTEQGRIGTLGDYEGRPVDTATVSIRNTGHGLEQAMEVEPTHLPLGQIVHVVLECEVEKHRYDPIKDSDGLQLVNMLKAGRATIVDRDLVEDALDEQERRIDEAKGEPKLEFVEDEAVDLDPLDVDTTPDDGFGLYDGSLEDEDEDDG